MDVLRLFAVMLVVLIAAWAVNHQALKLEAAITLVSSR